MTLYKYKICKYCKKTNEKIISLKHYFFKCNECNIIFREEKNKKNLFYLFKNFSTFIRHFGEGKSKENQFDYYFNINKNDDYKNKKYYYIKDLLEENKNIKDILDISGAPGNIGYNLKKKFPINYDLTEYDYKIVNHLSGIFNLNCYQLDFDDLEKNNIPKNKEYDLIVLAHCIYYSKNIFELIHFINSKLKKNGFLLISQNKPNFATLTKFSIMEGYAPYVFYGSNFINNILSDLNFFLIKEENEKLGNFIKHYFYDWSNKNKFIFSFLGYFLSLYYIILNFMKIKKNDLELENYYLLYRKK